MRILLLFFIIFLSFNLSAFENIKNKKLICDITNNHSGIGFWGFEFISKNKVKMFSIGEQWIEIWLKEGPNELITDYKINLKKISISNWAQITRNDLVIHDIRTKLSESYQCKIVKGDLREYLFNQFKKRVKNINKENLI